MSAPQVPMDSASAADRELRLECVRLTMRGETPSLELARAIYEFVTGARDATPAECITAAPTELERGLD